MKKILAIDDQPDNLITIKAVLKQNIPNCTVLLANSGKEGFEMASQEQPDTILLDIIMPGMDGYATCELLKSDSRTKHIPVVLVTAIKTDAKSRVKGLNLGADAFLSKPIDATELTAQVNVMLRIKAAEDELRAEKYELEVDVEKRTNELRESEKRYKLLYENAPLPFQSLNNDGRIMEINPAWLKLMGYKSDEVMGKWYGDFLHPDYQPIFLKSFPILKTCGSVQDVPFRLRKKDGTYIFISLNGQSSYFPDGTFKQTYCVFEDITERILSERALIESEQRYSSFVNAFTGLAFVKDENFRYVMANEPTAQFFGKKTIAELIGKTDAELVDEDIIYSCNSSDKKALESTTAFTNEEVLGGRIFEATKFPLKLKDDKKGIGGIIKDITERKLVEQALKESETKFRLIFENSPIGIYMGDTKGNILDANTSLIHILGSPSIEATKGINVLKFPPLVQNGYAAKYMECISSGRSIELEMPYQTKWGKEIFLRSFIVPLKNANDKVEKVYTLIEDITNRKRAEQVQQILFNISNAALSSISLKKLYQKIQKELGTIIDTTNIFIALLNNTTQKLEMQFFADENEPIDTLPEGKTISAYVLKTKKSLLASKTDLDKMHQEGIIDRFGEDSLVWLGVPLKIENKVIGVLVVQSYHNGNAFNHNDKKLLEFVSDQISQAIYRKKTEADLMQALEKATESDRLKSTFLATMSHELRTPLNAIIGFSDIIDETLSVDEIVNYNKIINTSGNHLLSIVNDLFDISLIETGEVKTVKQNVLLEDVMENILRIIKIEQQDTNKSNIELKLILPANNAQQTFNTDVNKLKQILINLTKNALKFTTTGFVHFGYTIQSKTNSKKLIFYVKDSGIGITKSKQHVIFNMFEQIEDPRTRVYGGTGIGLSVAKRLTHLLGGEIWVESDAGKGSQFFISFPLI
ncbi:MAG: PAS domain S-box protein [Prolixibacteraceae bacterium]